MSVKQTYIRVLAFAIITVLTFAASVCPAGASVSSVLVYDHGLAKAIKWSRNGNLIAINRTSSFTQDDKSVIAWVEAAFYSASFTWKWYNPVGQLYANQTQRQQCAHTPCYATAYLSLYWSRLTETQFGRWRVDLLNGNYKLYSDYFYLNPVSTQVDRWSFNVESSAAKRILGNLTVVIHPDNGTWSHYEMYMPYAVNATAFELGSNRSLSVNEGKNSLVTVDLGGPRSAGYSFVIGFDVRYGFAVLSGNAFAFAWQDQPWQRLFDRHPIYETFNITLPKVSNLIDLIGINAIGLTYQVAVGTRQSIQFDTTVLQQPFGWTVIYRDLGFTVGQSNQPLSPAGPFNPTLPLLPLSLEQVNVWSAVMAVFLLISSELASPMYQRSGLTMLINRRRLRIAALILVVLFIASTGYRLMFQLPPVTR